MKVSGIFSISLCMHLMEFVVSFVEQHSFLSPAIRPTSITLQDKPKSQGGIFQGVSNFFQELDAFMDDASARRLGNGAAFYGKRKSNFYGSKDKQKKANRDTPDPMEDYQGPTNTGLFVWMQDEETGEMKPVTRMKNKVIERNPKFWDRFYDADS